MNSIMNLFEMSVDDEFAMHLSSPMRAAHRRVRSDPSDMLRSIRAERALLAAGDVALADLPQIPVDAAPKGKRDLAPGDPTGFSPAVKKRTSTSTEFDETRTLPPGLLLDFDDLENGLPDAAAAAPPPAPPAELPMPTGAENEQPTGSEVVRTNSDGAAPAEEGGAQASKLSKKDVPMWTVEEDLLILQLVEQHGKRWSKIASHLPGRTDNGVRNRWNRMERAQVLRKARGPAAGYRCRRCGEPKRGHICAARTIGERPEGEDLHLKAAALTELSAQALQHTTAAAAAAALTAAAHTQPLATGAGSDVGLEVALLGVDAIAPSPLPAASATPLAPLAAGLTPAPGSAAPPLGTPWLACSTATHVMRLGITETPWNSTVEAVDSFGVDNNAGVDEFLDELRKALDDTSEPQSVSEQAQAQAQAQAKSA